MLLLLDHCNLINAHRSVLLRRQELIAGLVLANVTPLLLLREYEVIVALVVDESDALDLVIKYLPGMMKATGYPHAIVVMHDYLLVDPLHEGVLNELGANGESVYSAWALRVQVLGSLVRCLHFSN